MEFFLDTADVDEIREIASWGILDGVTTNPSLIKKSGRDFKTVVAEIASICDGPISAEVTALDTAGMVEQGRALKADLPENVIIKIPCTPEVLQQLKFDSRWDKDERYSNLLGIPSINGSKGWCNICISIYWKNR